jgi:LmbE family N-acetylglucosaminyl deacetylase
MELVVSAHFDDAVFSAAGVLVPGGAAVTVLTVCAGAPADGVVSEWDVLGGFTSGAAAAAVRAEEDRRANEIVGASTVRLGICDEPYQVAGFPHGEAVAGLAPLLEPVLDEAGTIWVPAGLGGHPDHVGTREAVLALVPAASGRVRFYADCPYAFAYGWDTADSDRAATHRWAPALARIEEYLGVPRAHAVRLDDETMRVKLAMLACHESQLRAMLPEFPDLLDLDGRLRRELYWAAGPAR